MIAKLKEKQALPLSEKIEMSKKTIREWHDAFSGAVYVAFSGGKDSTVMLHLVRSLYPDIPAVFINTGLEFPEILKFVRTVENVRWLKPAMNFRTVLKKYGYPVVSKRMAYYIEQVKNAKGDTATKRLRLTGVKSDGTFSKMSKISDKWQYLIDAPFLISDKCCKVMKKNPARKYVKETGRYPYIGNMASDSQQREKTYLRFGCNMFDVKDPKSTPLAWWYERDVWDYIRMFNIPYSKIYDMGYERTGCVFCMFGAHLEKTPNRFQRLKRTHPKLWTYCMEKLGLIDVLKYLRVSTQDWQMQMGLFGENLEHHQKKKRQSGSKLMSRNSL